MSHLPVLLLLGLPGSGKGKITKLLKYLGPEFCLAHYGIGPILKLDDYHWVKYMALVDQALAEMALSQIFFRPGDHAFYEPTTWLVLIELVNADYRLLKVPRPAEPQSCARYLLQRVEEAHHVLGLSCLSEHFNPEVIDQVVLRLEEQARVLWDKVNPERPEDLSQATVLIEFSRGSYQESIQHLSPQIQDLARILYVQVSAQESRRKNAARALRGGHVVPEEVMRRDYNGDDFLRLMDQGLVCGLPATILDNEADLTSFLNDYQPWNPRHLEALQNALGCSLWHLLQR